MGRAPGTRVTGLADDPSCMVGDCAWRRPAAAVAKQCCRRSCPRCERPATRPSRPAAQQLPTLAPAPRTTTPVRRGRGLHGRTAARLHATQHKAAVGRARPSIRCWLLPGVGCRGMHVSRCSRPPLPLRPLHAGPRHHPGALPCTALCRSARAAPPSPCPCRWPRAPSARCPLPSAQHRRCAGGLPGRPAAPWCARACPVLPATSRPTVWACGRRHTVGRSLHRTRRPAPRSAAPTQAYERIREPLTPYTVYSPLTPTPTHSCPRTRDFLTPYTVPLAPLAP